MPQTNFTPKRGFINTLPYDEIMSASGIEHQVALTQEQIKALAALVEYQRWGTRWHNAEAFDKDAVDAFIDDTIDRLFQELETPDICEDGSCIEIGAFHPALTYYPNNPKTQPDHEGEYESPVWITGAGFPGATVNDAMIDSVAFIGQDILALLQGGLLPSVTLEFTGDGEIDIQFLQTIQGGAAWVYPDGNILVGDLVNLQYADILDLAGTITVSQFFEIVLQADTEAFTVTHSVKFETSGDHTLTMVFFPTVEIGPPFFGIGGGLRSVQLCGGATVDEATQMAHTLEIEQDGTLKLLADGVPVSTVDLKALLDDDYVNVEGDTMTGSLLMKPAAQAYVLQMFSPLGDQISGWSVEDETEFRINRAADKVLKFQPTVSSLPGLVWDNDGFYLGRIGLTEAPDGKVRITGQGNDSAALGLNTNAANGYLWAGYQDAILRSLASAQGWFAGTQYRGYDYSSSSTWRKQFEVSGFWTDNTDATREGGMALAISDHIGDHQLLLGRFSEEPTLGYELAFFTGPGANPYDNGLAEPESADKGELAYQFLKGYGLIDLTPPDPAQQTATALSDYERCNAAWYIAAILEAIITDLFNNLSVVTPSEAINYTIETYNIPATFSEQINLQLQVSFASLAGVLDDLSDHQILADQLLTCDFDLDCMVAFFDGYLGWIPQTNSIVQTVLTGLWRNQIVNYIAQGKVVDADACDQQYELPCAEQTIDLRWNSMHGLTLALGSQVLTEGIHNGFDDPNYRADIDVYFDGCVLDQINVAWHITDYTINQAMHMYLWTSEPTTGAQDHTIIKSPPGQNGDALELFPNLSQFGTIYRVRIRMESETINSGNYIQQIYVYPD